MARRREPARAVIQWEKAGRMFTKAYLFQKKTNAHEIIMVWENADIMYYLDDDQYKFIGTITYDVEEHLVISEG